MLSECAAAVIFYHQNQQRKSRKPKSCPAESCNRAGSQRSACRSRRRKKTWPGASPVFGVSKWWVGWLVGWLV